MNKLSFAFLIGVTLSVLSLSIKAQEYMFTYSKLFTHMKQNVKQGHEDVKVGFFFLMQIQKKIVLFRKLGWKKKSIMKS